MGAYLRLLNVTFGRALAAALRQLVAALVFTGLMVFLSGDRPRTFSRMSPEMGAIGAGGLGMLSLLGWGVAVWRAETMTRCVPIASRHRFVAEALFATLMALPCILFCIGLPALAEFTDPDAAPPGPALAAAALLCLLGNALLLGIVAAAARNAHVLVRALVIAPTLFAGVGALTAHVHHGVPALALGFEAFVVAVLGFLYYRITADIETWPGGSTMDRTPAATAPAPLWAEDRAWTPPAPTRIADPEARDLSVERGVPAAGRGPSPASRGGGARVLIRAMLARPIVWVMLAVLLLVSAADAFTGGSSPILVFLLYFTAGFPLEVWSGFLASPFDRRRAFAALFGPLLLVWLICLGISWAGRTAHANPNFVRHFGGQGEVASLGLHQGEWPLHRATGRIPGWPQDGKLPTDVSRASDVVAGYLRELFGLDVSSADLLALRSATPQASADADWARAVQAKYEPAVRSVLRRRALAEPVLILCISLLAGWSLFAARSNSRWTRSLGVALPALIFLVVLFGMKDLGKLPDLLFEVGRFLLVEPGWGLATLAAGAVGLVALWYWSFRRLEAGAATAPTAT
jgi:hypothetical protein